MNADVSICKMKHGDVAFIGEIEKECFSCPWSCEAIEAELKNENAHFFCAEKDGCVLGYIGSHIVLDECYIANLAVTASARKCGIGQALIDIATKNALSLNCAFVSLEVRKSNIAAVSLYEKCGFTLCGERKNFYSQPQENALIMTKFLK